MCCAVVGFVTGLQGQENNYNEILNFVDSTQINIAKGRQFTASAVERQDVEAMQKGLDFLLKQSNGGYLNVLSFYEFYALSLLTGAYNQALDAMAEFHQNDRPVRYPDDDLSFQLEVALSRNQDVLRQAIATNVPNEEDRYMLQSLLTTYTSKTKYVDAFREENRQFVLTHPHSRYADFAFTELPMPLDQAGIFLTLGATYLSPIGTYTDVFKLSGWGLHLYLEFLFSQFYFTLMFHGGLLNVKEPFTLTQDDYPHEFTPRDQFSYLSGGVELGYDLLKNRKVMLAPAICLQGGTLESMLFLDYYTTEYQFFSTFIYGVSLSSAVKMISFKSPGLDGSYLGLKCKGGIDIPARHLVSGKKGSMVYAELGVVFGLGDL